MLFSQAAVAHLLSACPMKGQEGSSSWREIKGSEPDGGASCKQRQSPPAMGLGSGELQLRGVVLRFFAFFIASPYPELRSMSQTTEHLQWDTPEMVLIFKAVLA